MNPEACPATATGRRGGTRMKHRRIIVTGAVALAAFGFTATPHLRVAHEQLAASSATTGSNSDLTGTGGTQRRGSGTGTDVTGHPGTGTTSGSGTTGVTGGAGGSGSTTRAAGRGRAHRAGCDRARRRRT